MDEPGLETREPADSRAITTIAGDPISILGLGAQPDTDADCPRVAAEAGINWFFFYDDTVSPMIEGAAPLLRSDRNQLFISTGSESRETEKLEAHLELMQERLGVDVIDLFMALYVNPKDDFDQLAGDGGVLDLLIRWKEEGRIRHTGASAHDRELATQLVHSGKIDLLMHRYNMAHRKSEERVLPEAEKAGVPVLAFTATRWGTLMGGHPEWDGAVPTAADCYRFVLEHPAVLATYTAPSTVSHLRENVAVLDDGSRSSTRDEWEHYGALVYGEGKDAFETDWP